MYLRHFGLREAPFSITPDTTFFFAHAGAQAAFNTLLVALRSGEGFIKIVGEVGCGKTVLCRRLLASLGDDYVTAYIPNPDMESQDIMLALCEELQIPIEAGASTHRIMKELRHCLVDHARSSRRVVLCVDEAQGIPLRTVESLRLLSNLETEKRKLLQIVLFGQPELDEKLARPEIRQLLQRITFSEYIAPMSGPEVGAYVAYRLRVAGAKIPDIFASRAMEALAYHARGVPRLVNVIAHKSLMLAYGEGVSEVSRRHVSVAAADTPSARKPTLVQRLFSFSSARVA